MTGTFWAILPPVIAIILALVTKEVYLSLMIGIASGALMYHDFHLIKAMDTIFAIMGEKIGANCDILIFLVLLGILVALITKSGASRAYGKWAAKAIRTKRQALFATICLGVVIFVDDYFNCLTVGTVMRPVTDKYKVTRYLEQSYLILLMRQQLRCVSLHQFQVGQQQLDHLYQQVVILMDSLYF